ncbi:MAG: hypothetical protein ACYDA4_13450 [Ignavibacteriaceae bacterium]
MIEIKPNIFNNFICPECKSSKVKINEIIFPGIHVLADCKCLICNTQFLSDFPIGHALFYPVTLNKNSLKIYGNENITWFSKSLLNSYINKLNVPISIHKKNYRQTKDIILLNCIDYLYGHVLLKLFNAQEYLEKFNNLSLVIIIPKQFDWLVPKGVSEVWTVDIKLKDAQNWFVVINDFIQNELKRFSKVYLSLAFSHPEFDKIDIEKFTGIKPFNIQNFTKRNPTFTFIYREDRLWASGKFTSFMVEIINQMHFFSLLKIILTFNQKRKIIKTFQLLKNIFPFAIFNIVGIGTKGKYPAFINDMRKDNIDISTEKLWCKIYSESHLVIGIHGSNMLLPSALAAGFIELLPMSREDNFLQDIAKSFNNRVDVFLGRFTQEYIKPIDLASKIASVINKFPEALIRFDNSFLEHKIYYETHKWKIDGN